MSRYLLFKTRDLPNVPASFFSAIPLVTFLATYDLVQYSLFLSLSNIKKELNKKNTKVKMIKTHQSRFYISYTLPLI